MCLLVTGTNGFVGKHVCASLQKRDLEYICMNSTGSPEFQCDIHNTKAVTAFFKKYRPAQLLHLAWNTGLGYAESRDNILWLKSSIHLVNSFYENGGKRFVGVGSCFEYAPTNTPCNEETTPTHPPTLYGKAKLALLNYVQTYAASKNAPWAWCRPFYITGFNESEHRIVPQAYNALVNNVDFFLTNPYNVLDYMDVSDVAEALVCVLCSPYNGIVNIGSGRGVSLYNLLNIIHENISTKAVIKLNKNPDFPFAIVADTFILHNKIHFTQKFTLEQALIEYISLKNKTMRGKNE